jgi:NAD(P)-dependent dehydrogenase (short-subunit alcohol dehydrogenase family)
MPSVLVTGAARGIGKAIVGHLASRGWDVIAGVRSDQDAESVSVLNPPRISPVILDVTNAAHIDALPMSLPARLDAIVNNAGIVVSGPMEAVTSDEWRKQLEINVIGQLAVTQEVLPRLRESRGRIVFISSVNGKLSMALRMELSPWHIPVVLVEPAQTDTDMWRTADNMVQEVEAALTPEHRALYARHIAGMKKMIPMSQRIAVPTEKVSAVVEEALTARRPRARSVVGVGPKLQVALMTNLPTAVRDRVLRRVSGQP